MRNSAVAQAANTPRLAAAVCAGAASLCSIAGLVGGRPVVGVSIALGVVIGASNAYLAKRLLDSGLPFATTSLARLVALSSVAIAVGALLGFERVYLVILGLAMAQFLLVGVALAARSR